MNYDHWRHYARGWLLHFLGRDQAAYDAYVAALQCVPTDTQALRHLAAIAAGKARWAAAESWLLQVLALQPEDADSWFNLGYVREQRGNTSGVIDAFMESVRLKPAQDRAWYGLGLAHARLGHHAEAADAFEKAVELQPMNGAAYYQLGMARHHARHADEVRRVVVRLAGFDPQRARQLVRDAERADLLPLVPDTLL